MEAPAKFHLGFAKLIEHHLRILGKLVWIIGAAISHCRTHLVPHAFIRVQFRGVGRQSLQPYSTIPAQKRTYGFSPVMPTIVPDHNNETTQMLEQLTQEIGNCDVVKIGIGQAMEIKTDTPTPGADRKGRNDRHLIPFLMMLMNRCLPARSPGASNGGNQEQTAFVDEGDVGTQVFGVFFTFGQTSCFQCSIRSSSRSSALRSGFWQLNPMPCKSRPI